MKAKRAYIKIRVIGELSSLYYNQASYEVWDQVSEGTWRPVYEVKNEILLKILDNVICGK